MCVECAFKYNEMIINFLSWSFQQDAMYTLHVHIILDKDYIDFDDDLPLSH